MGLSPNCNGLPSGLKEVDPEDADEANVPFEPFKDLCKRRFLWYYQSYLDALETGRAEAKDQSNFVRMPFESPGSNTMDGKFNYLDLERRLHKIKAALDAEPLQWAEEGLAAVTKESTVAVNLKHQYDQVATYLKRSDMPHDVTLEDGNPFVWIITYFGRPMTNLDGGLFRIRMNFSTRFPDEQPRVRFETKIFHHHVAADGTACYTPNPLKREDVRSHIEAILATLEEDEPAYDPRRIVNPEATKLYWGAGKDDKKQYNRRLRRSVQQSMECVLPISLWYPNFFFLSTCSYLTRFDVGTSLNKSDWRKTSQNDTQLALVWRLFITNGENAQLCQGTAWYGGIHSG